MYASLQGRQSWISLRQCNCTKGPMSISLIVTQSRCTCCFLNPIKFTALPLSHRLQPGDGLTNCIHVNIFPNEKTFALRYQTTDMLETILRQGVLGEDDIREEFPKNLKLLSWRPAIVCETCLFSLEKDMRARAFISWIPKGLLK
ncbi:uncharacterized protein LOC141676508 isoform X2 [Apium graveolens]|uniref:uncharacterized protein LOC141676508 isoform X2 n=1 Tax=Apium graveolens TaxID=4045 RepID=UPI003D79BE2A